MNELEIIKAMATIKLAEIGITKNDKLFNFALEVWANGYLEAEKDNRQKNEYANMIEAKIKNMLK